jgi:hypothetical protein
MGQHWKFSPPKSIELNQRRNFFTAQHHKDLVGTPEFESIIVEFSSPPSIVFNRTPTVFVQKPKVASVRAEAVPNE